MKRIHLFVACALCLTVFSSSSAQAQYWFRQYGAVDTLDEKIRITENPYVGYFAGRTAEAGTFKNYVWLVDTAGNLQWETQVADTSIVNRLYDVHYSDNPGPHDYLACGLVDAPGSPSTYLSTLDGSGTVTNTRYYYLEPFKRLSDDDSITIFAMSDGYSESVVYWIDEFSLDTMQSRVYDWGFKSEGEEIFGLGVGNGFVLFQSVVEVGGISAQEMCAVRCDMNGDTLWKRSFHKEDLTELADGIVSADGGFVMAGACIDGPDQGVQLVKLDAAGSTLYDKLYFFDDYEIPLAIDETEDGGLMMVTANGSFWGARYLVKFDAAGDTLWRRVWHDENGFPTDLLTDGNEPVLGGQIDATTFFPTEDVFIARADADGYLPDCAAAGDCVWPGDTDYDGIANNFDLLPIGIAYGETGPFRAGGTSWIPQSATNWTGSLMSGVNYKHIDTDGNEIVEDADTLAIHLNYGFTHPRPAFQGGGTVPLYLVPSADSALAGETITIDVVLGLDTMLAEDIYGLAFTVNYDLAVVDESTVSVRYDGWFGDKGLDMITLDYRMMPGLLPMAITRIDGAEVTGDGTIASIQYVLDDDLGGRLTEDFIEAQFSITDVKIIRLDETLLDPIIGNASVTVGVVASGLHEPAANSFNLYPNPANSIVQFEASQPGLLSGFDPTGRLVIQQQVQVGINTVDLQGLRSGLYLFELTQDQGNRVSRLLINQ